MVKVKVKDKEYYMDGYLQKNLDAAKALVRKDWDMVYVIDGIVGAGKSVLAQQICHYVSDGDFDVSEIVFDPKEFRTQVLKSPKYNGIVFDEAFRGMSSRAAMTETNRVLMSMLQEIRQRNLFIFLCIPSIYDIDKYISLHRCQGLIHVDVGKDRERGFYKFYTKRQLMSMVSEPKYKYKYPFKPAFQGRFTKFQPIDNNLYQEKKQKALGQYVYKEDAKTGVKEKKLKERSKLLIELLKDYGVSDRIIAEKIGVVASFVNKIRNTQEKVGFNTNFVTKEV